MNFDELSLPLPLLRAVQHAGYTTPTPIQAQAIPHALTGRDLLGCAQTGTGKTAAFALPTLARLIAKAEPPRPGRRPTRVLVLTPTRELAAQVGETFRDLGRELPLRHAVIFGGVGYEQQERALRDGVDVLVATPGRLLDLLSRGTATLGAVEVLILDEADQMLDMGFIHDVRRIVAKVPRERQTMMFSATMPPEIRALASEWLKNPAEVSVAPPATTVERVTQKLYYVETDGKRALMEHLLGDPSVSRVLVFSRTKHGANRIAKWLDGAGIRAEPIHGNKSQNARTRALEGFKRGETRVLVATDIAARGLDIDDVTHVLNFDLPNVPETYVHRIGRTARAGAEGVAWSFCNAEERAYLRDIERVTRQRIPVVDEHPERSSVPSNAPIQPPPPMSHGRGQGRPQGPGRGQGQGRPQGPSAGRPQLPRAPQGGGGARPPAAGGSLGPVRPPATHASPAAPASPAPAPAAPPGPPARDACACATGTCGQTCGATCGLTCSSATRCDQTCNGGACTLDCNSVSGCGQRCEGGGCNVRCNSVSGNGCTLDCPGSNCTLTCNSTQSCRITNCTRGCTLRCTSTNTCENSCTSADAGCVTTR
ncbi:MAG: DEAD/DEAH box helicase [Polyangiales bacterium]